MDERHSAIPTKLTIILLVGSFTPALLAVLSASSAPDPRPISGTIRRDNLIFRQYAVDLGPVRAVSTIPAHFDFRNIGSEPIEILELKPSCGCLAPRLFDENKKIYAPGESGRFYVSVKTASETPGPKDYTVLVKYLDGQPKERLLSFRLEIPQRKVSVTPAEVYFYQIHGQPDSRLITVTDDRGTDLNVVSIATSSDLVEVTVGEKKVTADQVQVPIRLDVPGRVPSGRHPIWLEISTDDPEFQTMKVPVVIFGPPSPIQQVSGQTTPQTARDSRGDHQPESKSSER